jgi:hypothetical protein
VYEGGIATFRAVGAVSGVCKIILVLFACATINSKLLKGILGTYAAACAVGAFKKKSESTGIFFMWAFWMYSQEFPSINKYLNYVHTLLI